MATIETWNDPDRCPFCGAGITSPGASFVDHVADSPDCEAAFGTWRDRIASDVQGGWSGYSSD